MDENKKFLILLLIIVTIFSGEKVFKSLKKEENPSKKEEMKIIIEKHTYAEKDELLDINEANERELLSVKVNINLANKILDYREVTGGFLGLDELMRIDGVGEKTYSKLSKKLKVETEINRKPLKINKASKKEMKYYGLSKKEITKIEDYIKKNDRIFDNLVLMELLGEERYEEYKDIIICN